MTDTVVVNPTLAEGKCSGGIIVSAVDEFRVASLALTFSAVMYRAEPLDLPPAEDIDNDGVANRLDTCPLRPNPRQSIDPCQLSGVTGFVSDSDGDNVGDEVDNCLWVVNPPDSNTGVQESNDDGPRSLDGRLFPSGIGAACDLQSGEIETAGDPVIRLVLGPIGFQQPVNQPTIFTVDMNSSESVTCDWDTGVCVLDPDQIQFCINHSTSDATFGCQF